MTVLLSSDVTSIHEAVHLLHTGRLVAFPTETVYGLGADATDAHAVARLYAAKGRPSFNPLIAHVATLADALTLGEFSPSALELARSFWPGPLTLVVPARPDCSVCELARSGLPTLAIRIPAHPVALALLTAAGRPIVAPSANRSGHVSPTRAEHVLADLDGVIDAIIDAGPCTVGVESTILNCLQPVPVLLRPGGISLESMNGLINPALLRDVSPSERPQAPGMLASHYAPHAKLRMNATSIEPDEAALTFGSFIPEGLTNAVSVLNLSISGSLTEAAAQLFDYLRRLDQPDVKRIAVTAIPAEGLGMAINDRLKRASAKRD